VHDGQLGSLGDPRRERALACSYRAEDDNSPHRLIVRGDVTESESLDYGSGGQLYGTMEGRLVGDRVAGSLRLTNLAVRRADNINLPTLRGILTTDDDAVIWVELDGIATLRASDNARVFVTACRFRTGDER
jgi:hypothetical protein